MLLMALPIADVVAPTLAAILSLPPSAAGDLALAGREHAPIEQVQRIAPGGLQLPGFVEVGMTEPARVGPDGCLRRQWRVVFQSPPHASLDQATLTDASVTTQIGLPRAGTCPSGRYVHLNPGIREAEGFTALRRFDYLRSPHATVRFSCVDETRSNLCVSTQSIQRALGDLSPWAVTRDGDWILFWLGTPGSVVTEVRFTRATPNDVLIRRSIPAPA